MSRCPTSNPLHADCDSCDGEVLLTRPGGPPRTDPIRLPRSDANGFPVYDTSTGELLYVNVPLPKHVEATTHSSFPVRP